MRTYALYPRPVLGAITIGDLEKMPSCDINMGSAAASGMYRTCCNEIKRQAKVPHTTMDLAAALKKIAECAANSAKVQAAEVVCVKAKTGVATIDDALEKCCKVAATGTGNVGDRAKQLALCTANAAANAAVTTTMAALGTAACAAAGAVTAGITTALAATGICGIIAGAIGSFLYNRIAGYSTGALIVGGLAAAVCGAFSGGGLAIVCGFLAAELTQWLSDTLGPVLEGIFDPNAAKRREYEARQAILNARDGVAKMLLEAGRTKTVTWKGFRTTATVDMSEPRAGERCLNMRRGSGVDHIIIGQWTATIGRLWDLYDRAFPDQVLRDAANRDLGITGTYHSLALSLVSASQSLVTGALAKLTQEQQALLEEAGTLPRALPFKIVSMAGYQPGDGRYACEIYGRLDSNCRVVGNQTTNPRSPICPDFIFQDFIDRDTRGEFKSVADYEKAGKEFLSRVTAFFSMLPNVEGIVASKIAGYAASRGVQIKLQFQATTANLMTAIRSGAVRAQAAAVAAGRGNEEESARAVGRAERAYKVSDEAYKALSALVNQGNVVFPTAKDRADSVKTVEAAKQSVALAHQNYAANKQRRLMLGITIAAGVAGSAYMLLRKKS